MYERKRPLFRARLSFLLRLLESCPGGEGFAAASAWLRRRRRRRRPEEEEEEQCVICLERFEEGDRLRVLPCSHLFHVSCIDKWLSGSYSDMECFTSGCPTCKKHPVQCHEVADLGGDTSAQNEPLDGSLPSWAFTQLGDALASSESTA